MAGIYTGKIEMANSDDDLLTEHEVSADPELGRFPVRTLQSKRLKGDGPPFLKIGHLVRYRRGTFKQWLASLERKSTSDIGPPPADPALAALIAGVNSGLARDTKRSGE